MNFLKKDFSVLVGLFLQIHYLLFQLCVCVQVVRMYFLHSNKELIAAVMQTFKGHVRPMLRHAGASSIIEYAYNDKALLAQRLMLTEELYGNTFTVCKVYTHTRARTY